MRAIHERLVGSPDLKSNSGASEEELWERAEGAIVSIVEQMAQKGAIPQMIDQEALIKDVLNEALGLGPLEDLLGEGEVSRILVNRYDQIYVEKGGNLTVWPRVFSSEKALAQAIGRIPGLHPADGAASIEGRLTDGSRVIAVLPPLAVRGPCLTIRKPQGAGPTLAALAQRGALSSAMAEFLELALRARRNVAVSSTQPAAGQTLLAALAAAIPSEERLVSVERVATIELGRDNWVQLEARPPQVTLPAVLESALRMRPDRLLVDDVQGPEALELMQTLAGGEGGALLGVRADSPRQALARLETLVQAAAPQMLPRVASQLCAQAIHIVVEATRTPDGQTRITQIVDVAPGDSGPALSDVFGWRADVADGGRGKFAATGFQPRFCEELPKRGLQVNPSLFRD
jgi:pilus assembly protein CpaF